MCQQQKMDMNINSGETPGEAKMKASYKAGAFFTMLKMEKKDPESAKALKEVTEADVVVVDGTYDHAHLVLELAGIPFVRINTANMDTIKLRPDQTLFINCPGQVSDMAIRKIVTFVNGGGLLITTDWALKHVIERAFPKTMKYNQKPTQDEVVRINVLDPENPILDGFLEEGMDPLWWLEGSSYPIVVQDKKKVNVLVESKELEGKYGEAPVICEFSWGEGRVVHMISHFYLQRSETRDKKDMAKASSLVSKSEMAMAPGEIQAAMGGMAASEYTAAQSSVSFISKNIAMQKKKSMKKKG
ncbi:MAG: hypothetical protein QGH39_12235 [Candidatus Thermoplasmatota archaeon]|nr:hypothetical protein [Candidatus Thermoplasmatota archaeon]